MPKAQSWVYITAVTMKVDPPVPGDRTRGPEKSSEDLFFIKIVFSSLIHTHTHTQKPLVYFSLRQHTTSK